MTSKNMHYVFNVEYFQGLDFFGEAELSTEIQERNRQITDFCFPQSRAFSELDDKKKSDFLHFSLFTCYPGLLLGIGNPHDAKLAEAFKLGFSLDYVTGLPYMPGSSLKGLLRAYCSIPALVQALLGRDVEPGRLVSALFEGNDVYLGAYPKLEQDTALLDDEYITPHPSPFDDPNPISFMKIRPNVEIEFGFLLHDDPVLGMTAEEKLELFKKLLLEMGVGAKTHVGYGRMAASLCDENVPGFSNDLLKLIPAQESSVPKAAKSISMPVGSVLGPCPKCGANVVRSGEQAVCEASCGMRFRRVCGAEVGDAELSRLLHGGSIVIPNVKDVDINRERPARISLCREGQSFCPDGKNGEKKGLYRPKYIREWLD